MQTNVANLYSHDEIVFHVSVMLIKYNNGITILIIIICAFKYKGILKFKIIINYYIFNEIINKKFKHYQKYL